MEALIIVDMLNDFVRRDAPLYVPGAENTIPAIKREIEKADKQRIPVIFVCDAHDPDDEEFSIWPAHCVRGTEGAQVVDELKPKKHHTIIEKTRYSGFFRTNLEETLRNLNVDTVRLTGVATNICVLYTAADAFMRGFRILVVSDGVEGLTPEDKEWALKQMKNLFLAEVV